MWQPEQTYDPPWMQMFEYRNLDYDTTVVEDPIILNKWYTALPTRRNVKAWYLVVEQTNNGAAAETIGVEVTVNGNVNNRNIAALVDNTPNYMFFSELGFLSNQAAVRQLLALDDDHSAPLETRSLRIRVRQTTAVDVVAAQIEVNMVYATLEATY